MSRLLWDLGEMVRVILRVSRGVARFADAMGRVR